MISKRRQAQASPKAGSGDRSSSGSQPVVGARIRELRKVRRLTLQQLAHAADLSVGYISQLERDLATPSIKALQAVARSLGVNVSWFLPDPEHDSNPETAVVVRARRRRLLNLASGVQDELLSPSLSGQLELMRCRFEPGANSGDESYAHEGEEAGFVAAGQLDLTLDGVTYRLNAGDSFQFDSTRPHRYHNPGPEETVVIWAMTPPRY